MREVLPDDAGDSLAWSLLFGVESSEPGTGEQLADAAGRPLRDDLVDEDVCVRAHLHP